MDQNPCVCPVIKQGDAYCVPVELYLNGTKLTAEHLPLLEKIEVTLGVLDPLCLNAADAWNEHEAAFLVPLTQAQTFALDEGRTELDVRVRFRDGNVIGIRQKVKINVADAASEVIL